MVPLFPGGFGAAEANPASDVTIAVRTTATATTTSLLRYVTTISSACLRDRTFARRTGIRARALHCRPFVTERGRRAFPVRGQAPWANRGLSKEHQGCVACCRLPASRW